MQSTCQHLEGNKNNELRALAPRVGRELLYRSGQAFVRHLILGSLQRPRSNCPVVVLYDSTRVELQLVLRVAIPQVDVQTRYPFNSVLRTTAQTGFHLPMEETWQSCRWSHHPGVLDGVRIHPMHPIHLR